MPRKDEQAFYDTDNDDYAYGPPWMNGDRTIDTRMILDDQNASEQFRSWLQDKDVPSVDYRKDLSEGMERGRQDAQ